LFKSLRGEGMKIAFLLSTFPQVSETFILNQITGLIDRGHEVDIFAFAAGSASIMHPDIKQHHLLDHTYYVRMPKNKLHRLIGAATQLVKSLSQSNFSLLRTLNVARYGKKALGLSMLYTALLFLDKGPYDIIHCHFGPNGNLGIQLREIGALKGKIVVTFHGYDMTSYVFEHGTNVYDYLLRNGDLFLPVSQLWKNELISWGCSGEKIRVHHMGIATQRYTFGQNRNKRDGKVNILSIARLVEKKGIQYGIEAVGRVIGNYPNIEYRIVGDGPMKREIESVVTRLNLGDKVKLLGWKNQEEVLHYLKDADFLLAPSVTARNGDREGIPVVLMEAMAMGLPVLSTCHSGIPELVQDGVTGFLVPEGDIAALADRLVYLLAHPERRLVLGVAARRQVEDLFDSDKLNDDLVGIYQSLLDSAGSAHQKQPIGSHVDS
jgi:colanic acid/amylovoran biosynthesis glycosyltransferase